MPATAAVVPLPKHDREQALAGLDSQQARNDGEAMPLATSYQRILAHDHFLNCISHAC